MNNLFTANLADVDAVINEAINNEIMRQTNGLELIASENFVSEAVFRRWERFLRTSMPKVIQEKVLRRMRICRCRRADGD